MKRFTLSDLFRNVKNFTVINRFDLWVMMNITCVYLGRLAWRQISQLGANQMRIYVRVIMRCVTVKYKPQKEGAGYTGQKCTYIDRSVQNLIVILPVEEQ